LVDSGATFEKLLAIIPFEHRTVRVFGATHFQPRLTKWYGPVPYTYSGLTWEPCEFPPLVEKLRRKVEIATGGRFNSVLCNLYRDGRDTVSWHSDDEPLFGSNPEVASLSYGGPREFQLCHKVTGDRQRYLLGDEDLLFMARGVQEAWQHRLPRVKNPVPPRINLTFRFAGV